MSRFVCLDGEHTMPPAIAAAADPATATLQLGHCPACPDTELVATGRAEVRVCPCCWSAWWTEDGVAACTPGAVLADEPAYAVPAAA